MKILIIDENIYRVGGVERVISTLANNLCENNDVHVISEYKSKNSPFYKYNKKINIKYIVDSRKYYTNNVKSKNLLYYFFRIFEKVYSTLLMKKKIKNVIKEFNNYDLIIFGRVFAALDFLRFINICETIKTKIIVRDAIHLNYYSEKIKLEMKKYFPLYVNKFIVSSDESMNTYKEFFQDSNINLHKIYNPIGIQPICNYNFNSKTIVSIGRFDKQKGFENLIASFSIVHKKHNDWKLKIYGFGNYENKLKKEIKKYAAYDYVELLPATTDVVKVFNNSSIFVLPSRYEGYANILVEALSCGIPSISYNWLMGVEEIIKDNFNGLVVNLKDRISYFYGKQSDEDIINLSEAINKLIENKKLCDMYSKNSVMINDSRNIDVIIKKWLDMINDD